MSENNTFNGTLTVEDFKLFCKDIFSGIRKRSHIIANGRNTVKGFCMIPSFDTVFPKMTHEEQMEYAGYSLIGQYIPRQNIILMGSDAIQRVRDFQNKMIEKYK